MIEVSVTRGHTGRSFDVTDLYGKVKEWVNDHPTKFPTNPLFCEFKAEVEKLTPITGPDIVTFRGRCCENPPGSLQMGPPRMCDNPGDGRYHEAGERILYLSSAADGCLREIARWIKPGMPYIQEYRLPTGKLGLADFTNHPDKSLITYVFEQCESLHVAGLGNSDYKFSQMIAKAVAAKFDGMIVRGSRGEKGITYTNTVVFQPHPGWEAFLAPSCSPVPGFSHEEIAEKAYLIWERQGKPSGMHMAHWFLAVEELKRVRSTPYPSPRGNWADMLPAV